jgi:hypothetical protein
LVVNSAVSKTCFVRAGLTLRLVVWMLVAVYLFAALGLGCIHCESSAASVAFSCRHAHLTASPSHRHAGRHSGDARNCAASERASSVVFCATVAAARRRRSANAIKQNPLRSMVGVFAHLKFTFVGVESRLDRKDSRAVAGSQAAPPRLLILLKTELGRLLPPSNRRRRKTSLLHSVAGARRPAVEGRCPQLPPLRKRREQQVAHSSASVCLMCRDD